MYTNPVSNDLIGLSQLDADTDDCALTCRD